jgi:hypothetical protein
VLIGSLLFAPTPDRLCLPKSGTRHEQILFTTRPSQAASGWIVSVGGERKPRAAEAI